MRLITSEQATTIDDVSMNNFNISANSLMGNAGNRIAQKAKSIISNNFDSKILVICGKGNNGGDAYAAASILYKEGYSVSLHSIIPETKINNDSYYFYKKCISSNITCTYGDQIKVKHSPDLIIDGLIGIGLKGGLRNNLVSIINWINNSNSKVLSIDIPSGLDCNNGIIQTISVKADVTITFGAAKVGMFLRSGPEYCGKIFVEDIGFPNIEKVGIAGLHWRLFNEKIIKFHYSKIKTDLNKYSAGKVLIIAGSRGMSGAAILSTYAALRSGAGMTLTANPSSLNEVYEKAIIEGMTLPLDDDNCGIIKNKHFDIIMDKVEWADSVLLGPGLGRDNSTQRLIKRLFKAIKKPLVLDADGLYPFTKNFEQLNERQCPLIITPHFGELQRLSGQSKEKLIYSFTDSMMKLMKKFYGVCLIKQIPSCIFEGNNVIINNSGNPGLATAGTGDVLSGLIASLLSQGLSCYQASSIGAFIHGKASDDLIKDKGRRGQIASDLLKSIPKIIKKYES